MIPLRIFGLGVVLLLSASYSTVALPGASPRPSKLSHPSIMQKGASSAPVLFGKDPFHRITSAQRLARDLPPNTPIQRAPGQ